MKTIRSDFRRLHFFVLRLKGSEKLCDHLTDFGFPFISGHCVLHSREADCLKAKLSPTGLACNSRLLQGVCFFQVPLPAVPGVSSRTFPLELVAELELVEFQHVYLKHVCVIWLLCHPPILSPPPPHTHTLFAKRAVINGTLCSVDIFI